MWLLLCLEFANKILIFAVLEWRLLQLRETVSSFVFITIIVERLSKFHNFMGRTKIIFRGFKRIATQFGELWKIAATSNVYSIVIKACPNNTCTEDNSKGTE